MGVCVYIYVCVCVCVNMYIERELYKYQEGKQISTKFVLTKL